MPITRFDPFGEIVGMQREMDRIMSRLGGIRLLEEVPNISWMPRADVIQDGEDLIVHLELPGVKKDDVDIDVTDGVLTIRGERKMEESTKGKDYVLRERAYGSFERTMVLPEGTDPGSISADYNEGVLEVRVPRAAGKLKPQTTKVAITGAEKHKRAAVAAKSSKPHSEEREELRGQ